MVGQELAKGCQKVAERKITFSRLMYGSCHLESALNVEIVVEYQIFVLQFGLNSRYYKGALTQKR